MDRMTASIAAALRVLNPRGHALPDTPTPEYDGSAAMNRDNCGKSADIRDKIEPGAP